MSHASRTFASALSIGALVHWCHLGNKLDAADVDNDVDGDDNGGGDDGDNDDDGYINDNDVNTDDDSNKNLKMKRS